jgi:hypothetical protein
MPLVPKLNICVKNTGIFIYDITGLYSLDDNAGGFGDPNEVYADITSAVVTITNTTNGLTDTITLSFEDLEEANVLTFGPFPNPYGDGIWKIKYKVVTSEGTYEDFCIERFFMPNADCCVDTYLMSLLDGFNMNDVNYLTIAMKLSALRKALILSAYSLNKDRINYYLNQLNQVCKTCVTV